eukprot:2494169-Amphidinium_carterae.1
MWSQANPIRLSEVLFHSELAVSDRYSIEESIEYETPMILQARGVASPIESETPQASLYWLR